MSLVMAQLRKAQFEQMRAAVAPEADVSLFALRGPIKNRAAGVDRGLDDVRFDPDPVHARAYRQPEVVHGPWCDRLHALDRSEAPSLPPSAFEDSPVDHAF